ncbi:MAG TPA: PilZ domain-containing protein [Terriglobales bacterium]|jgi:hypothetical protein|nr:PilZ domain-containing protein [Terriglobales bacterium]
MSTPVAPGIPTYGARTYPVPRMAAFDLEAGERERIAQAFRNVKLTVEVVPAAAPPNEPIFDAAVLRVDKDAAQRLNALRSVNRRMLIYLIGPMPEIARLANFGVNAALENLSDAAIARAVEHTYLLLAGKLRRYTRVPIYVPLNMFVDGLSFTAITEDLSAGGISALAVPPAVVSVGKAVAVRIVLPSTEPLQLQGVVCWISAERVGVQFDRGVEQDRLRKWVEEFLS